MNKETRQLAGMYFLFMIFLFAASVEETRPPVPAAAPRLAPAAVPGPSRLRKALASTLRAAGFSPLAIAPDRFTFSPRAAAPLLVWTASSAGAAKDLLARTAEALADTATRHAGRVVSRQWSMRASHLRLDIALTEADGRTIKLCLQTPLRQDAPLAMARRPATPPPVSSPAGVPPPKRPEKRPASHPRVAIILDDVGVVAGTEAFLALPAQITIAVLPLTPHAETYAGQAVSAGRTVILHLPLEPLDGKQNPGPGVIRIGSTSAEVKAQLAEDLRSVPGVAGVNNHMGSRGTTDEPLMLEIMAILKEKGLFFLDSRTFDASVKQSVVRKVARSLGERYAERDIFLDPDGASVAQVQLQLRKLITLAKKNGSAIGICHANRPNTLAALTAALPEFAAAGVEIVPLSELVHY